MRLFRDVEKLFKNNDSAKAVGLSSQTNKKNQKIKLDIKDDLEDILNHPTIKAQIQFWLISKIIALALGIIIFLSVLYIILTYF
jgi:hypothetical protein